MASQFEQQANGEMLNVSPQMFHGIIIPELSLPDNEIKEANLDLLPDYGSHGLAKYVCALELKLDESDFNELAVMDANQNLPADMAIPAHRLVKSRGQQALAELVNVLSDGDDWGVETRGSFINFSIDRQKLTIETLSEIEALGSLYGANSHGQGEKVILDTSSPNIAKQMHLGHLRSTVIGESLSRILCSNGYTTIRDNHVGDWGTQFGLLGRAVELWGEEVPALQSEEASDQVKGLLELYVRINQAIAEEKTNNQGESQLEDAGREWFANLEQGDERAIDFWRWASNVSMLEFEEVYSALGVSFEYTLGESVYQSSLGSTIQAFKNRGLTYVDDKGVVKVKPATNRQDALGIQKPDGASLYGTRDIATLAARLVWFDPKKILYVVGDDQGAYFSNLFEAFKQFAPDETEDVDIEHVKFGKVTLPEGSMSTRRGNVVFLIDVLNKYREAAIKRVSQNLSERAIEASESDIEEIAEKVAVGSLIYFDLMGSASREITYNPDSLVTEEGNTGASLQYSVARINAIMEKANQDDIDISLAEINLLIEGQAGDESPESELVFCMSQFPAVVRKAAIKYEPSLVAEYIHKLASAYNKFYAERAILNEPNRDARLTRLKLTKATRQVMINGLNLLNIPTPNVM